MSRQGVPVAIEISLDAYPIVAAYVEQRGFETVAEWLAFQVDEVAKVSPADVELTRQHRLGKTDAQIATALGWYLERVRTHRRALNLKPNPRPTMKGKAR